MISAHTFAYISLDAMIPQEADQTHIEYGFPVGVHVLTQASLIWAYYCFMRIHFVLELSSTWLVRSPQTNQTSIIPHLSHVEYGEQQSKKSTGNMQLL